MLMRLSTEQATAEVIKLGQNLDKQRADAILSDIPGQVVDAFIEVVMLG
jgi:hypothetical protein